MELPQKRKYHIKSSHEERQSRINKIIIGLCIVLIILAVYFL